MWTKLMQKKLVQLLPALLLQFEIFLISGYKKKILFPHSQEFLDLVAKKIDLNVRGNEVDLSMTKKKILQNQIEKELNVVLKGSENFSFDEAWKIVSSIGKREVT